MPYQRTEDFREWCMERHARQPVWVKLFDCERCVMQKEEEVFPFFTELADVVKDRCHLYNVLLSERSFLTSEDKRLELFDWVVDNTSGRFTLIERSGWEGVLFDTVGDFTITQLMFSEYHAKIVPDYRGWAYYSVRHPPHWRGS